MKHYFQSNKCLNTTLKFTKFVIVCRSQKRLNNVYYLCETVTAGCCMYERYMMSTTLRGSIPNVIHLFVLTISTCACVALKHITGETKRYLPV